MQVYIVQRREILSSKEFLECHILHLAEVTLMNGFPGETKPRLNNVDKLNHIMKNRRKWSQKYLCFDDFSIHLNAPCSKFDTYGGLRLKVEFISREARQKWRFPNTRVSN